MAHFEPNRPGAGLFSGSAMLHNARNQQIEDTVMPDIQVRNYGPDIANIDGYRIAPGRVGTLDRDAFEAWAEANPRDACQVRRWLTWRNMLARGVHLLSFDDLVERTKDGKPTVGELRRLTGRAVTAAERDQACLDVETGEGGWR